MIYSLTINLSTQFCFCGKLKKYPAFTVVRKVSNVRIPSFSISRTFPPFFRFQSVLKAARLIETLIGLSFDILDVPSALCVCGGGGQQQ